MGKDLGVGISGGLRELAKELAEKSSTKKYHIVQSRTARDLESQVEILLQQGWSLVGGPFATTGYGGTFSDNTLYYQAVVRE